MNKDTKYIRLEPKRTVIVQKSIPQNSEIASVRTALLSSNAEFTCQEGQSRYDVKEMSLKLIESLNLGTEPPDLVCDVDCDRNTWIVSLCLFHKNKQTIKTI